MITVSNLDKAFGGQLLFEGVQLELNAGERYGLVGANGSGKTTFLKILQGDEPASGGSVSLPKNARIGVLRQDQQQELDARIIDVAMRGDALVMALRAEQEALMQQLEPDAERIAELEELMLEHDGYSLETRARKTLVGLGLEPERVEQPLSTLSGGFRIRVELARVLLSRPSVLLLDEPTNHLDIVSIAWLEDFLLEFGGCLVFISHDRRFLNRLATQILDVDYASINRYSGNYDRFIEQKLALREQKEAERARAAKAIAQKQAFVERFRAKASKARQAQSRLKQIERIQVEELPDTSRRAPHFRFTQRRPSGRDVLSAQGVSKAYAGRGVLEGVSLALKRGERLAVIGANGLGKSTLLKLLTGHTPADAGQITWGHEVSIGYFPQDHSDVLREPAKSVLDALWDSCPDRLESEVRGLLGRMLFSGDEVQKTVAALSGGEAARLVFALLIMQSPNVLVLDEPTNHLDLETIEAMASALETYEGTIIFVSHDRWLVSRLGTRILELQKSGVSDFPGTYPEYLDRAGSDHLDVATVLQAEREQRRGKPNLPSTRDGGISWQERKRLRNRSKSLPQKRDRLLADISATEAAQAALRARFWETDFYDKHPADAITKLRAEEHDLGRKLAALMQQWEEVEAELGQLEAASSVDGEF